MIKKILVFSSFIFCAVAAIAGGGDTRVINVVRTNPVSGSTTTVQGTDAHDAAITGNPVLIGGYASTDEPTAVSTDGDAVRPWLTKDGRIVTLSGHGDPEAPDYTNCTASAVLISSPAASTSLYINKVYIHNAGSSNILVSLTDGSGGATGWKGELASEGGAVGISFGSRGWKLSAATNLYAVLGASGDVDITVTEFYIAP